MNLSLTDLQVHYVVDNIYMYVSPVSCDAHHTECVQYARLTIVIENVAKFK